MQFSKRVSLKLNYITMNCVLYKNVVQSLYIANLAKQYAIAKIYIASTVMLKTSFSSCLNEHSIRQKLIFFPNQS